MARVRWLASLAGAAALFAALTGASLANAQTYDGLKKTIAVDTVQASEAVGGSVTADGLTALLTDALSRDPRFVVVERPGLSSVTAEQGLSGVNSETAVASGNLIGASAIVRAAVTKYDPAVGGVGVSIGGPVSGLLSGRAGAKSQKAMIEISLRLIDTMTGQVISTAKAQGFAKSSSADAGVVNPMSGRTAGVNTFSETPIGQAAEDAIKKAVDMIAEGMKTMPWSAQVVAVGSDGGVFISAGADRNMTVGTSLVVYRKGQVLTDPSTGQVLDIEMTKVATLRIATVRDKVSTAVVVDGDAPTRGDLVRTQ